MKPVEEVSREMRKYILDAVSLPVAAAYMSHRDGDEDEMRARAIAAEYAATIGVEVDGWLVDDGVFGMVGHLGEYSLLVHARTQRDRQIGVDLVSNKNRRVD